MKIVLLVMASAISFTWSKSYAQDMSFQPSPKADERGFIDVWQLREDVIAVEALQAYDDFDWCYYEGDPDEVLGAEDLERQAQEEDACIEEVKRAYAVYTKVRQAFNEAWLPLIYGAIESGDKVAEVIMRQCDTTPVLKRDDIESTCDREPGLSKARQRLREIGFMPAVDIRDRLVNDKGNSEKQRSENQLAELTKARAGSLGYNRSLVGMNGNVAKEVVGLENYRRWSVMEAISQDAPRAFTFSPGYGEAGWRTSAFTSLRLNRQPETPGYLTRGQLLHYAGGRSIYTGPYYWRFGGRNIHLSGTRGTRMMAGPRDQVFLQQRSELLAEIESNIDAYLAQDPRWAVFLLHRVGRHEWVPEGTSSDTDKIHEAWLGDWALEEVFLNWSPFDGPIAETIAHISREGDSTTVSFKSKQPPSSPIADARNCQLRYSGGLTFLPSDREEASMSRETVFGYLRTYPIEGLNEVLKPFDPKKRYKQVLVQCPEGESLDNNRARYLLLAEDTMIEVATDKYAIGFVRHFGRVN